MIGFPIPTNNFSTNIQPIPSVYNEGFSQYETIAKMLYNTNEYITLMNYLNDTKLSANGDFKGTWNGLPMQASELGLASDWNSAKGTFPTVSQRLDNVDNVIKEIDGGYFGDYIDPVLGNIDGGSL